MKSKDFNLQKILNYIAIIGIAGIIPLLLKYQTTTIPPSTQLFFGSESVDIFINVKVTWFLIFAYVIGVYNLLNTLIDSNSYEFIKEKSKNPLTIGILCIVISALIAFIFSDYKDLAFYGAPSRGESIFVLYGYIMCLCFPIIFLKKDTDIKLVVIPILISSIIIAFLGAFQLLFYDILVSEGFSKLYLREFADTISVAPAFDYSYSTLFNPNYLGTYCALLLPFSLGTLLAFRNSLVVRILSFINILLLLVALLGSESEAGYIGLLAGIVVMLLGWGIYYYVNKEKTKALIFTIIMIALPVIFIIAIFSVPSLRSNVDRILNSSVGGSTYFTGLDYDSDSIYIDNINGTHTITIDDDTFYFYDESGALLIEEDYPMENKASFSADTANSGKVTIQNNDTYMTYTNNNTDINFVPNGDNTRFIGSGGLLQDVHEEIPSIGFENSQGFASNRGYIWSHSIPLMLDSLIIGQGSDSFIRVFPQEDVEGKLMYYKNPNIVVDKPHNTYLLYAINDGFISLIGYLIIIGFALYLNVKEFLFNSKDKFYMFMHIGLIGSITAYLVNTLSNDQNINVSPVFWIILGISFGIVYIKKGQKWFFVK